MITGMKTRLCYLLILILMLPALAAPVAMPVSDVTASNTDSRTEHHSHHQHEHAEKAPEADTPSCHSRQVSPVVSDLADNKDEDACCDETAAHQCSGNCCSQHCAAISALLAPVLALPAPVHERANTQLQHLPEWLFFNEPPPPVNI